VLSRLFTGAGAVATSSFFGVDDLLVSVELATTGFGPQVIKDWERDAGCGWAVERDASWGWAVARKGRTTRIGIKGG